MEIMQQARSYDATGVSSGDSQEAQDASQRSGSIGLRTHRRKRGNEGERSLLDWIPGSGITSDGLGPQQNDRLLRTSLLFRELEVRISKCYALFEA